VEVRRVKRLVAAGLLIDGPLQVVRAIRPDRCDLDALEDMGLTVGVHNPLVVVDDHAVIRERAAESHQHRSTESKNEKLLHHWLLFRKFP